MKTESKKKRFLINSLSILIILVIVMVALNPKSSDKISFDQTDIPSVSFTNIVDLSIRSTSQGDRIKVALTRSGNTVNGEAFAQDILTVYKWGDTHFAPVKCGGNYPKELCKFGFVEVWLLTPLKDISKVGGGKVDVYQTVIKFVLDQRQIEDELSKVDIRTVDDLVDFHQSVARETGGTGGGTIITDYLNVFLGFNK